MNLINLHDYVQSKAFQLENSNKEAQTISLIKLNQEVVPVEEVPKVKILNIQAGSSSIPLKTNVVRRNIVTPNINRTPKRSIESPSVSPSAKQFKLEHKNVNDDILKISFELSETSASFPKESPQKIAPLNEIPVADVSETPPQNKLLALFEVTPDQYKELSERLSTSERNNKVESLVTTFLDKRENETDFEISENGERLINFHNFNIHYHSLFDSCKFNMQAEIEIIFDDDKRLKLDLFWLRDHCRCENCYDHSTFQRRVSVLDIPEDIKSKSYDFKNGVLKITCKDNILNNNFNNEYFILGFDDHQSSYDLDFLIKNQFGHKENLQRRILWDKNNLDEPLKSSCRCVMRDYMSDPDVSKSVLLNLHRYGVAFIDGVQPTQNHTEFVIRQLFPIHRTLFGDMWTFSDEKRDHSDTAYTNCE